MSFPLAEKGAVVTGQAIAVAGGEVM